jgi:hypothetical protein
MATALASISFQAMKQPPIVIPTEIWVAESRKNLVHARTKSLTIRKSNGSNGGQKASGKCRGSRPGMIATIS